MIAISVEKAHGDYDPGTSKFFGSPTMPENWLTDGIVGENDFFFCQLNAGEYAPFDSEGLLPHSGFIYIFLSENNGTYIPNVRYCPHEPDTLIEDFNAGFDFIPEPEDEYSIDYDFSGAGDNATALLSDYGCSVALLKYDPLDDNMPPFLAETEKTAYFTIKKEALEQLDFSEVEFMIK